MENRLYYKEKLIVQIGEEIKLTRKAKQRLRRTSTQTFRIIFMGLWFVYLATR